MIEKDPSNKASVNSANQQQIPVPIAQMRMMTNWKQQQETIEANGSFEEGQLEKCFIGHIFFV